MAGYLHWVPPGQHCVALPDAHQSRPGICIKLSLGGIVLVFHETQIWFRWLEWD